MMSLPINPRIPAVTPSSLPNHLKPLFQCNKCFWIVTHHQPRNPAKPVFYGVDVSCPFCEERLCWTVCFCSTVRSPHTRKTSYCARWYEKHISSLSHRSSYNYLCCRHRFGINLRPLSAPAVSRLAHDDIFLSPNVDTASDDVSADDPDTPSNILDHFLPADFAKASFLTPLMIKYHRNEYDRPGYGLDYIVSNAFQIT
jgi:hypothetical protein